jgi:PhzF family phenazine biosynthesis protein
MKTRPFKQVDVFTATPYQGNPLAVVLDGADLSSAEMQRFAHWTNLSETTFLLPPTPEAAAAGADYRVRIFCPGHEMPFAGHPTLGSCHAWLQAGGVPRARLTDGVSSDSADTDTDVIVQECAVGLVKLRRDGTRLAFAAPPLQRSAPDATLLAKITTALGLEPHQIIAAQLLDNGPVWLGLLLDSVDTVLQLTPDHSALKTLGQEVGVAALEATPASGPLIVRSNREARAFGPRSALLRPAVPGLTEIEVRAFAAPAGIDEDPVTGSLNASLAQWLIADGHLPSTYLASQGACLGRNGQVHITQDESGQVWVGGDAVTCIDGSVQL